MWQLTSCSHCLQSLSLSGGRASGARSLSLPVSLSLSRSLPPAVSVYLLARNYIWLLIALCIFMDGLPVRGRLPDDYKPCALHPAPYTMRLISIHQRVKRRMCVSAVGEGGGAGWGADCVELGQRQHEQDVDESEWVITTLSGSECSRVFPLSLSMPLSLSIFLSVCLALI